MQSINQTINQNQSNKEIEQKLRERIKYHRIFRKWRVNNPTKINKSDSKRLQIEQRYKSFIKEKDLVFIRGLADYIEAVKKSSTYSKAIEKIYEEENIVYKKKSNTVLIRAFSNSIWGSWFYLELVHLLHYRQDIINEIFGQNLDPGNIPFDKEFYIADINRVHFHFLEQSCGLFESNTNEDKPINYRFNQIGSPSGILKIKGFEEVNFNKQRAQVLQFFYLCKSMNTYSDYQDFNTFIGAENKRISSNQFRLIVNSINRRVKKSTSGLIKELIQKQDNTSKAWTANRYGMIEF
jgi:hypothetical protein